MTLIHLGSAEVDGFPRAMRGAVKGAARSAGESGLWIEHSLWAQIRLNHSPRGLSDFASGVVQPIEWPTAPRLLADYASAVAPWAGHAQVLPEDKFRRRWEACGACPLWRGDDVARCADVRRQCERLRIWLASESCLQERWKTL